MDQQDMANFWETIVDTMPDGLIVVDASGVIVAVNRSAEQLTGYGREELIHSPCTILKCDHCSARHSGKDFTCALFEKKQIDRRKCTIVRKEGERVPIIKNASVLIGNDGRVVGGVETLTDRRALVSKDRKIAKLSSFLKCKDQTHGIVGKSKVMQDVCDLIADAAQSDSPIIIYGESGTGKELVATALHNFGRRKDGPFIKVNCAALPESLFESELFGHTRVHSQAQIKRERDDLNWPMGATFFSMRSAIFRSLCR